MVSRLRTSTDDHVVMTFMPHRSNTNHADLPGILFSIANARGLFMDTLEDILDYNPRGAGVRMLKVSPDINLQPLFLNDWSVRYSSGSKPHKHDLGRTASNDVHGHRLNRAFYVILVPPWYHYSVETTPRHVCSTGPSWTSYQRRGNPLIRAAASAEPGYTWTSRTGNYTD